MYNAKYVTVQCLCIFQEENEENELPRVLETVDSEAARYALEQLAQEALRHAHDAARSRRTLADTRAQLLEVRLLSYRCTIAL